MSLVLSGVLLLIIGKAAGQIVLARLNRGYVLAHRNAIPEAFINAIQPETYAKSAEYTLAKNALAQLETVYEACILIAVLWSSLLPLLFNWFRNTSGPSAWSMAAFLFGVGLLLSLPSWPLSWYAQLRIEQRFGFNTTTQKLWWMDRIKGLMLSMLLGYPLLVLVLKLVEWMGNSWWLCAWAAVLARGNCDCSLTAPLMPAASAMGRL